MATRLVHVPAALLLLTLGPLSPQAVLAQDDSCVDLCSVACIKPWSIPDRWDDATGIPGYMGERIGNKRNPDWRNNGAFNFEQFTDQNESGKWNPGEPYNDFNANGRYDVEYYDPSLTGYGARAVPGNVLSPNGDIGLELTLIAGNPSSSDPPTLGHYFSVDLPPINKGTPIPGGDEYRKNIAECNPVEIEKGDWLATEPGLMTGPTNQGMRDLIAQDPDAEWDDATQSVVGSNFAVSPRIVFFATYDPHVPILSGRATPQVTKVVAFFMEEMTGPAEVRGRLLRTRGEGAICQAGAPSIGSFVTFCPPSVGVDIRPGSCPNPLNLRSRGVLPAAILGTRDFDVSRIDPASIRLAGVSPLRASFEDVASPVDSSRGEQDATNCTSAGSDGFMDLALKFDTQAIIATLGAAAAGETRVVKLTCSLKPDFGGDVFTGEDVVTIVGGPKADQTPAGGAGIDPVDDEVLSADAVGPRRLTLSAPNPYCPQATLSYTVTRAGLVRLGIYDPRGHVVATLVSEGREAGTFATAWNGRDERGRTAPEGVYFIRLQVDGEVTTGKIVLAR